MWKFCNSTKNHKNKNSDIQKIQQQKQWNIKALKSTQWNTSTKQKKIGAKTVNHKKCMGKITEMYNNEMTTEKYEKYCSKNNEIQKWWNKNTQCKKKTANTMKYKKIMKQKQWNI